MMVWKVLPLGIGDMRNCLMPAFSTKDRSNSCIGVTFSLLGVWITCSSLLSSLLSFCEFGNLRDRSYFEKYYYK
jgi:hypothetical protein